MDVSTCSGLQRALDASLRYRFSPGVKWVVHIQDGMELRCDGPVLLTHPQPQAVEVRGPPGKLARVVFTGAGDGFVVDAGHVAWVDGLHLIAEGEPPNEAVGILVRNGGTLGLGSHMRITGFPTGLKAADRSVVRAKPADLQGDVRYDALRVEGARVAGVWATSGAVIHVPGLCARASGVCIEDGCEQVPACAAPESDGGHGVRVELGAVLHAPGARLACHARHGALVRSGGTFTGSRVESTSNGCDGLHAAGGAVVSLEWSRFVVNGRNGAHAEDGASIDMNRCSMLNNGAIGLYAEAATVVAPVGNALDGNRAEAIAADHGATVWFGRGTVHEEFPGDRFARDVCVGVGGIVGVARTQFRGRPWDKPVANLAAYDRNNPFGGLLVWDGKTTLDPLSDGRDTCRPAPD